MVQELVDGGTFLLNCPWDMEGLEQHLPGQVKKFIADHNIKFYTIDGVKIGMEIGTWRDRINTVLQSAFFKLANIIPEEQAIELMKAAAKATYGRKGDDDRSDELRMPSTPALSRLLRFRFRRAGRTAEDEGLDRMAHVTERQSRTL